jgi:hypothetical protein
MDNDVQVFGWHADVFKRFGHTFDKLRLLFLISSLPHFNNYYWHCLTLGFLLERSRINSFSGQAAKMDKFIEDFWLSL